MVAVMKKSEGLEDRILNISQKIRKIKKIVNERKDKIKGMIQKFWYLSSRDLRKREQRKAASIKEYKSIKILISKTELVY